MSINASISLGTSVLVVSTKPGNIPGQATLQKKKKKSLKSYIFFLAMTGRHPELLSRGGVKTGPLALC